MWVCKTCKTKNDDEYSICYRCGYVRSKKKGADFRTVLIILLAAALVVVSTVLVVLLLRNGQDQEKEYEEPAITAVPTSTPAPTHTPAPTPTATPRKPGPADISGSNVAAPKAGNWLDAVETMYVKSKHGQCIYMYAGPDVEYDKTGYVYEAEKVTVLARQNGFSLILTENNVGCWVKSHLLVYEY